VLVEVHASRLCGIRCSAVCDMLLCVLWCTAEVGCLCWLFAMHQLLLPVRVPSGLCMHRCACWLVGSPVVQHLLVQSMLCTYSASCHYAVYKVAAQHTAYVTLVAALQRFWHMVGSFCLLQPWLSRHGSCFTAGCVKLGCRTH
jgi:hypothetical protein